MKKFIIILLASAILTGCGNITEDKPYIAEETTTASQITEATASDTTEAVTSKVTVTSEATTEKSSQSVTDKMTTAAANTNDQPKKDNTNTQTAQDNKAQEVRRNESKTTTKASTLTATLLYTVLRCARAKRDFSFPCLLHLTPTAAAKQSIVILFTPLPRDHVRL